MKKLIKFIIALPLLPIALIAILGAMLVTWLADNNSVPGFWKEYWITGWKDHFSWYLFR